MAEPEATQSVWKRPVNAKAILVALAVLLVVQAGLFTMTSSWTRVRILLFALLIAAVVRVFARRHRAAAV